MFGDGEQTVALIDENALPTTIYKVIASFDGAHVLINSAAGALRSSKSSPWCYSRTRWA
jgi:hypothetical protein